MTAPAKFSPTPGPWIVLAEEQTQITISQGTGDRNIVHIRWPDLSLLTDEDRSNARLIAAAPRLLKFLHAYRFAFSTLPDLRSSDLVERKASLDALSELNRIANQILRELESGAL